MKLLGISEIATLLNVSRQVISNWKSRKEGFPQPISTLASGPVWLAEDIESWAETEGITISEKVVGSIENKGSSRYASIVAMMNMKGGVGKSTLTQNIGWYAAYKKGMRILFVDLDPQFNLSQYVLGANGYEKLIDAKSPTVEVIFEKNSNCIDIGKLIQKVHEWDDDSCIHIIPANLELAFSMRNIQGHEHMLRDKLETLRTEYDLIIMDCAPTESSMSTASYFAADSIFIPVKPEFLSTIGLPLLARSMSEFAIVHPTEKVPTVGGIIFNDIGDKLEHNRSVRTVKKVATANQWPIFNSQISHSDSYPAGSRAGKPIFLTDHARNSKISEFEQVGDEFLKRLT
ncbi:AAA family ATPase [Deefgea piscis]|uniref:AAA family ATPase n=1 Tax=Deefgea piscis TaxID=2739061 RepID=UPI001C80A267|nr:AAA family ATPase [Deefgea piscis]QZA80466.1 AAA family ATPase [Deefgea piscis]